MRLLLDTHAFVWALAEPERLSAAARAAIANPATDAYVSLASAWELAILQGSGRVRSASSLESIFSEGLAALRIGLVSIQLAHVNRVAALPLRHRDPFDRLLIATALAEHLTIVTADRAFDQYAVSTLW